MLQFIKLQCSHITPSKKRLYSFSPERTRILEKCMYAFHFLATTLLLMGSQVT